MAATIPTKEIFEKTGPCEEQLKEEIRLRIKAGAITSKAVDEGDKCVLVTEWNVIGEQ